MTRFTTINDVVLEIRTLEPGFEFSDEELEDIIRDNRNARYEDMTAEDVDTILLAAYAKAGVPAEQTERIVNS